jgi:penicillin-insensitive murein DD-endopeptidase
MAAAWKAFLFLLVLGIAPAKAQDPGTLHPEPLPPLQDPNSPQTPAKELFARKTTPLLGPPQSIGSYANGCLAGAIALPITGSLWQVMRVSRNRYWGNPSLVGFIERLADSGKKVGWNGLLIGDMSQARGGPMLAGHSSHQVGLDVDIWFTPMPDHELSPEEREFNTALNMVAKDRPAVDPKVWTYERTALVRVAAQDPVVARIFVNPAIKKAMCREAGTDRSWLSKVRPWWGHDEHFHVRIACPSDSPQCKPQSPAGSGDGCGHELDTWLKESIVHPPATGAKPKHNFTLAAMPKECRAVAKAP